MKRQARDEAMPVEKVAIRIGAKVTGLQVTPYGMGFYSCYLITKLVPCKRNPAVEKSAPLKKNNKKPKLLIECSTLTVSIHRVKSPVRSCGYINPKGFARGARTIAGTLILTQFNVDALFRFLQAVLPHDFSRDTNYFKVDQLPPFNATILFSDEYGNASYRRLLGLEFVTDGTVYSIQDMLSEQTISYMASDFTPLLLVNHGVIFDPGTSRGCPKWIFPDAPEHGPDVHTGPFIRGPLRCRLEADHRAQTRTETGNRKPGRVAETGLSQNETSARAGADRISCSPRWKDRANRTG